MGNIIQALSGKNKVKDSDDNAMVKKLEQQLQLFKANPVFTMFLKFVEKLGNQVEFFRVEHDFTMVSNYVKKVEQHVQQIHEKYVLPIFYKFVESLPSKPREEEDETKAMALTQAYALGGFFILKWAWERWIQPRADDSSEDD